jgi:hypothetical protein
MEAVAAAAPTSSLRLPSTCTRIERRQPWARLCEAASKLGY